MVDIWILFVCVFLLGVERAWHLMGSIRSWRKGEKLGVGEEAGGGAGVRKGSDLQMIFQFFLFFLLARSCLRIDDTHLVCPRTTFSRSRK